MSYWTSEKCKICGSDLEENSIVTILTANNPSVEYYQHTDILDCIKALGEIVNELVFEMDSLNRKAHVHRQGAAR